MSQAGKILEYHSQSKHRPHAFAPGPGGLDWATQPEPFRWFDGAEQVALPLVADGLDLGYTDLRRPDAVPPRPVNRESVALLLELSLGLSAWKQLGESRWALRCNPSSGNLHPTEGYVVLAGTPDLEAGVFHYLSRDHLLERRSDATLDMPAHGLLLGLSSIHWREAWKYGMRAYRYCQLDVGHALAAARYAAAGLGWVAVLQDHWSDADIGALLGLHRDEDFGESEREVPDLVLWVGARAERVDPAPLCERLAAARWSGSANRLSPRVVAWEAIDAAERNAVKPATEPRVEDGPDVRPSASAPRLELGLAEIVRQRRSGMDYDGETWIDADDLFAMLDALLPRPGVPPWDALPWLARVHPLLFVHRVRGLAPGLYLLLRDDRHGDELREALRGDFEWQPVDGAPGHLSLVLLTEADTRDPARAISCVQDIAADGCLAVAMLARLGPSVDQGAWWYRWLLWEAGVLGQVLYLEAEAAGVRGTGIGCFFDDALHRLVGLDGDTWQTVYHFTAGGPVEDPRLQSLPPYG